MNTPDPADHEAPESEPKPDRSWSDDLTESGGIVGFGFTLGEVTLAPDVEPDEREAGTDDESDGE